MTKDKAIAELVRIWHSPHLDLSLKTGLAEAIDTLKESNLNDSLVRGEVDVCKESESKLDLISRQDVIKTVIRMCAPICDWELEKKAYTDCVIDEINSLPSAEPPVLTCDGCRHAGTYDTDFPCSGCIRREKDYYEQER